MPVTKEQYNQLYPGGCPFKVGDKLTLLSKAVYLSKIGGEPEKLICGGYNSDCCYDSSGWIVERISHQTTRHGNYHTEISVRIPSGVHYTMTDIEFVEFWKNKSEVLTEYQIY